MDVGANLVFALFFLQPFLQRIMGLAWWTIFNPVHNFARVLLVKAGCLEAVAAEAS
jgi:hypothetical protein